MSCPGFPPFLRVPIFLVTLMLMLMTSAGSAMAACDTTPPPTTPGAFDWPVAGRVMVDWSLDCRTDRGHRGIDITTVDGSPIRAAASGTVAFVGYTPAEGGGLTMTVDHESGLRTTYLHLKEATIKEGQQVLRGQVIAAGGGEPLHFGIRLPGGSGRYFDPLVLLPPLQPEEGALADETAPVPVAGPVATGLAGTETVADMTAPIAVAGQPAFDISAPQDGGTLASPQAAMEAGYAPESASPVTVEVFDASTGAETDPAPGMPESSLAPGGLQAPSSTAGDSTTTAASPDSTPAFAPELTKGWAAAMSAGHAGSQAIPAPAASGYDIKPPVIDVKGRRRLLLGGLALMLSAVAAGAGRLTGNRPEAGFGLASG